jgi:TPR repeat protein
MKKRQKRSWDDSTDGTISDNNSNVDVSLKRQRVQEQVEEELENEAKSENEKEKETVDDGNENTLYERAPQYFDAAVRAFEKGDYVVEHAMTLRAAELGHSEAQTRLAEMYRWGRGIDASMSEALRWYRSAANNSVVEAQTTLGWLYYNGHGVERDYGEALHWGKLAASQGYVLAQYGIGRMYENGRGVKQDFDEALRWYAMADACGDPFAAGSVRRVRARIDDIVRHNAGHTRPLRELCWHVIVDDESLDESQVPGPTQRLLRCIETEWNARYPPVDMHELAEQSNSSDVVFRQHSDRTSNG